jgi:hypothetical protein
MCIYGHVVRLVRFFRKCFTVRARVEWCRTRHPEKRPELVWPAGDDVYCLSKWVFRVSVVYLQQIAMTLTHLDPLRMVFLV